MRKGDLEGLFARHAQSVFAFLVYRTGDRTLAEDLLSETFERALRARRRFDPRRGGERAWLHGIALNCLREDARRARARARAMERSATLAGADASDAGELGRVELRDELARALGELSDEEREAVALRFGADLTAPEIARLLALPLTTVEGRIYRALRRLRQRLGSD